MGWDGVGTIFWFFTTGRSTSSIAGVLLLVLLFSTVFLKNHQHACTGISTLIFVDLMHHGEENSRFLEYDTGT